MNDSAAFLSQIFDLAPNLLQAVLAMIASASAVTALTPTPRDDTFLGRLYGVVEVIALNVGRAKQLPPNRPTMR